MVAPAVPNFYAGGFWQDLVTRAESTKVGVRVGVLVIGENRSETKQRKASACDPSAHLTSVPRALKA